jgi:hypothetical protein
MKPLRHPNGFAIGDLVQLKAEFRDQRPTRVQTVNSTTLVLQDPRAGHYVWGTKDVEMTKSGLWVPDTGGGAK